MIDLRQSAHVNLSKATKLKEMVFTLWPQSRWLINTLRTVTRDHKELEEITLDMRWEYDSDQEGIMDAVGEAGYQEWLEVDHLLIQLCESHSIRLSLGLDAMGEDEERSPWNILLPGVMARRVVDLASEDDESSD